MFKILLLVYFGFSTVLAKFAYEGVVTQINHPLLPLIGYRSNTRYVQVHML